MVFGIILVIFGVSLCLIIFGHHWAYYYEVYYDKNSGRLKREEYVFGIRVKEEKEETGLSMAVGKYALLPKAPRWHKIYTGGWGQSSGETTRLGKLRRKCNQVAFQLLLLQNMGIKIPKDEANRLIEILLDYIRSYLQGSWKNNWIYEEILEKLERILKHLEMGSSLNSLYVDGIRRFVKEHRGKYPKCLRVLVPKYIAEEQLIETNGEEVFTYLFPINIEFGEKVLLAFTSEGDIFERRFLLYFTGEIEYENLEYFVRELKKVLSCWRKYYSDEAIEKARLILKKEGFSM